MPATAPPHAAELLELASRAARAAGALLAGRALEPATGVSAKSSRTDLVSDADRDAEALIVAAIRVERPGDAITAEEGAAAAAAAACAGWSTRSTGRSTTSGASPTGA